LPLTLEEIANFIGTTQKTLIRILSEFWRRRLVAVQGSTLTVPNRAALENFVCASEFAYGLWMSVEESSQIHGERRQDRAPSRDCASNKTMNLLFT
jgi:hypothetical protein